MCCEFPFNNKIKTQQNDSGEKATAIKKASDHSDVDTDQGGVARKF